MSKSLAKWNKAPRVAVIGCGVFGALISLRLAHENAEVSLFERRDGPLLGASFNNQNRLHLGFHYPRDDETARQCIKGFLRFKDEFGACILSDFTNIYLIAERGSKTTPENYLAFCDRLGLRYDIVDLENFTPAFNGVSLAVKTDELVYDCKILAHLIKTRLDACNVRQHYSTEITKIERAESEYALKTNFALSDTFDYVVNCTYANLNFLNSQLGFPTLAFQYEYTFVPIIEWEQKPIGITVMDGNFMTVLPFGKSGHFLLYHVKHSVVVTEFHSQLPSDWLDPLSSPLMRCDAGQMFKQLLHECLEFVPTLDSAKMVGYLQGPRVVLKDKESSDTRPSIIQQFEPRFWSVFSGKIDHSIWVADEISSALVSHHISNT